MSARISLTIVALVLTTLIMRAPITCVGPVAIPMSVAIPMRNALEMGYGAYGLLSSLPVGALGIFCLFVPVLQRLSDAKRMLLCIVLLLSLGLATRLSDSIVVVYMATIAIGASIAMLNAVLPVVIKSFYPKRISTAMAVYTAGVGVSSTAGTYLSGPLFMWTQDYRYAIGIWLPVALLSLLIWSIFPKRRLPIFSGNLSFPWFLFMKQEGWAVALTMGIQSLTIFTVVAWLPSILQAQGFNLNQATVCVSIFLLISFPGSIRNFVSEGILGSIRNFVSEGIFKGWPRATLSFFGHVFFQYQASRATPSYALLDA